MASNYSLPSSLFSANGRRSPFFLPSKSPKTLRLITVVHSFQDEGRSTSKNNNMVDENLSVLKKRMEMVKVKERLERCCRCEIGWNYDQINEEDEQQHHDIISKNNQTLMSDLIQIIGLVCGTVGSTCLSGTLLLCLFSLLAHHHSLFSFN
ncbi:hypothetical protein K1719_032457 [Acacia pycnantha]|nr:hypothetical protein K1719_032457 [Acacia pycnantha]